MAERRYPCQETLHKLFRYDPETGELYWRQRPSDTLGGRIFNAKYAGKITANVWVSKTGTIEKTFTIHHPEASHTLHAHRCVWIMHHGPIPAGLTIDHRDGDRTNNRVENLRLATGTQNNRNRKLSVNNRSGFHGVIWNPRQEKWVARVSEKGRYRHLGCFYAKEDAIAARQAAELLTYGEFSPLHRL